MTSTPAVSRLEDGEGADVPLLDRRVAGRPDSVMLGGDSCRGRLYVSLAQVIRLSPAAPRVP